MPVKSQSLFLDESNLQPNMLPNRKIDRVVIWVAVFALVGGCTNDSSKTPETVGEPSSAQLESQSEPNESGADVCSDIKVLEPWFSPITIFLNIVQRDRLKSGERAPDFTLSSMSGDDVSLYDVLSNNEVVLVNYWASWCGPCIKKLPDIKDVYANHGGEGFEILAVSLDSSEQDWEDATVEYEIPGLHVRDDRSVRESSASGKYRVNAIPSTFLVDSHGCILHTYVSMSHLDRFLDSRLEAWNDQKEMSKEIESS
ncbi:MAG: TlpA disulfide reductase family protein [Gammaproteobacteria bacterium]|nr:TlpA disulfide reductase family protein [Gammaproteobacteria bacterium]